MNTQTFSNNQFDVVGAELRVPRLAQDCFKWAGYVQACRPLLMLGIAVIVAMVESVVPTAAQSNTLVTGNPDSPFEAFRTLIQLVTWALVGAGILGVAWALINGMRRHAWGAQLGFGLACLGFSGIVALLSNLANGDGVDIPQR